MQSVTKRNQPTKQRPMSAMVQVMPSSSESSEKPEWMKNLRNRASLKSEKGVMGAQLNATQAPKPKPDWMANLQKSKSIDLSSPSVQPNKSSPTSVPLKPMQHFQSVKVGAKSEAKSSISEDPELNEKLKKFQTRSKSEGTFLVSRF